MADSIKGIWLTDSNKIRVAPYTLLQQIYEKNGSKFDENFYKVKRDTQENKDRIDTLELSLLEFMQGAPTSDLEVIGARIGYDYKRLPEKPYVKNYGSLSQATQGSFLALQHYCEDMVEDKENKYLPLIAENANRIEVLYSKLNYIIEKLKHLFPDGVQIINEEDYALLTDDEKIANDYLVAKTLKAISAPITILKEEPNE